MKHFLLAAAFTLAAASAHAASVGFTPPPADGSSVAVGTVISAGGAAAGSVTGLDLTVVIDTSGSMSQRPLSVSGDNRLLIDITTDSVSDLLGTVADGAVVSAIDFDSFAVNVFQDEVLSATTRPSIDAALAGLGASGGTDFSDALDLVLANGVNQDDVILFFSDGQFGGSFQLEAEAIAAAGGIVNTIGLPGTDVNTLEAIATAGGGSFFDLTNDVSQIVNVLTGTTGGGIVGLSGLEAIMPDGSNVTITANAFGQFILPDFAIGAGANVFTINASFDDGSSASDTLTINGTTATGPVVPAVPLPAAAWLMIAALAGLGGVRRFA